MERGGVKIKESTFERKNFDTRKSGRRRWWYGSGGAGGERKYRRTSSYT